ncbi:T9SS type A sorting domain-containing protein [Melioribacteraceae bacterium 4301-Me]|uniref:T9SS type A sorting domain-containing protein n=1 Tax=Pyranulibacter aquaticus TaxID=3163344 RepID=UPI0035960AEC
MKKILLTVAAILCLLELTVLPLGLKLYAQDTTNIDPYQYFPAYVGNRWVYEGGNHGLGSWSVSKDSIDLQDSSRYINPSPDGAYYKIDKNYNVFFAPNDGGGWLMYKLDAKVGDSWRLNPEYSNIAAKVRDISPGYVFGKLTTIKTIDYYILTRGDTVITEYSISDYWERLAYGFGVLSWENGAEEPDYLVGCRINGVNYGTLVGVEENPIIPSEYVLYQNYPNPFNPSTTTSFSLPEYSYVVIKVFDILGREVKKIVSDYFIAGKHSVEFNAGNLPSGIYFYQLITDKTTKTMKMLLQK